ncbi:MAG: hypothetical protein JWP91_3837 [Fibrobacteres bacterium]|nr:hypothetical protein [Fibrobacterota bacterium]
MSAADRNADPALRLLTTASDETGDKALLILAGDGTLAEAFAPRFSRIVCHNAYLPQHMAAASLVSRLGISNVECLLGDLPCSERIGAPPKDASAGMGNGDETFLPGIRYPEDSFDCIAFRLGRGTAQVNAVLAEAFRLLKPEGRLLVAGHNQEGIKSFAKRAEAHFGNMYLLGIKSSCRLLRFTKESAAPVEPVEDPRYFDPVRLRLAYTGGGSLEYLTKPGIFAYRATDPGTALLALHLPSCAGKSVLDLGCGSGALSLAAFALGAKEVLATDNSAIAIACAERNFALHAKPGRTLCTELAEGAEGEFDLVFSNPPFHKDGETDYGLPARILDSLWRHLKPGGEAYLVANQFLDYPAQARKQFGETSILARDAGYIVHRMVKAG